jgi:hypothetical protein
MPQAGFEPAIPASERPQTPCGHWGRLIQGLINQIRNRIGNILLRLHNTVASPNHVTQIVSNSFIQKFLFSAERMKSLQSKLCVWVKRVEVGVVMKVCRVHRTAKANVTRGRPLTFNAGTKDYALNYPIRSHGMTIKT